jgi:hypothetical protein
MTKDGLGRWGDRSRRDCCSFGCDPRRRSDGRTRDADEGRHGTPLPRLNVDAGRGQRFKVLELREGELKVLVVREVRVEFIRLG